MKLLINSSLNNVYLVGVTVRAIGRYLSFDETGAYHLELCVVEAVNNVIKHAYLSVPTRTVEIRIDIGQDKVTFSICDTGLPLVLTACPSLEHDLTDIPSLPESGRGLYIIQSLMEEVSYRTEEGVNIFSMSKRIPTHESRP